MEKSKLVKQDCCSEKTVDHHEHKYVENSLINTASHCGCNDETSSISLSDESIPTTAQTKAVYRIKNMDCPTEEALIRKKLATMPGIIDLEFNLMQRILTVNHQNANLTDIEVALTEIDMDPEPIINSEKSQDGDFVQEIKWKKLAVAGVIALSSELTDFLGGSVWLVATLAIIALVLGGLGTYKKGWIALKNFNLNMNVLMSFAVTGAILIGQFPEAAMVMVLFALAEAIEAKSMDRARNAIKNLLSLTPAKAAVLQADGSWSAMDVNQVTLGSTVRVKPGERIALDGEIITGQSTINQAPITGESLPIDKNIGDTVFAGTINEAGSFDYRVTTLATQSTLARIIKAVESAQGSKAQTQRFVDRFAKIYTPIVFFIALVIGIIPPLLLSGEWFDWIYKGLIILVIACPCALVISTPVTIVSGLAAAARYGILIKGGIYLEQGRKLAVLALDKTGTITYGKPQQTNFVALGSLDEVTTKTITSSLAARSDHPVSQAIVIAAKEDHIISIAVNDFVAVLGQGIRGNIDGCQWYLGNLRMVNELGISNDTLTQQVDVLERQGNSVVMLMNHNRVEGLFAVADMIKESSVDAITELNSLGVKTVMLTGDNNHTAQVIASQVGISEVKGNLLPEDKLSTVKALSSEGVVGMVGDGINDAPALAQADIGFAMGMGTDTAIETADVALMDDDLRKISQFIGLSKSTFSILVQNITFALAIKVIFFVLTFIGDTTMWMAVFADIGTSLIVVANGLRLLRK